MKWKNKGDACLDCSSILLDEDGISIPTARIVLTANKFEDLYKFTFVLLYRGQNIRRLDIDDTHSRRNPSSCPEYTEARISGNHMHVWNPESGDKCAIPVDIPARERTYKEWFDYFLSTTNLVYNEVYNRPPLNKERTEVVLMLNCEIIKENISTTLGEKFECIPVSHFLVINTPFTYPNLDTIQIYAETLPNGEIVLSDQGETLRYLASYLIDPDESPNKAAALKSVTSAFGIEYREGVLYKRTAETHFGDNILDMANSMLRISDFQLLQKVKQPRNDFYQEVEELIKEIVPEKEDIERRKALEGNSGKKYYATYFVKSAKAVIEPLAHPIQAVDWTKIATVFQEFYDLKNKADGGYNFYAILDDEDNDWPDEPKVLLSDVSKILLWSRRRQWKDKILKEAA